MKSWTEDTFFNGRIKVRQHRSGYRFSIDALLLASHARPGPDDTVLDLGTGCGIIPLILAYRHPRVEVFGVEVQADLADTAVLNIIENGLDDRITVLCMDMKSLNPEMTSGPVDLVVSNPPFRKAESGRINPNRERAVARHEIKATLKDVVETGRRMLRTGGRFAMVYLAERMTDLLTQMRTAGIEPKSIRTVHSGWESAAKLVLVEGKKGGRAGIEIGPPLIIYRKNGAYTDEVETMFMP